jgi:Protein of unknown function (DUF3618)
MTAYEDRAHAAHPPTSADYQREAEHTRRRLALNLDELSDRLTPGQVFDEMLTYSRAGGGTFFRAFSNAMRENPLPSLMIGAGCVMFLSGKMGLMSARANGEPARAEPGEPYGFSTSSASGGRLSETAGRVSDAAGRVSDAAGRIADSATSSAQTAAASVSASMANAADATRRQTSDLLAGAVETAKHASAAAGDTAGSAADAIRNVAHSARDVGAAAVTGAASSVRDTAASMGGRIADMSGGFGDIADRTRRQTGDMVRQSRETATSFISEQPLLCAAIGIAIGATLATVLPSSSAEDKLMGETSDAVKDAAQRTGSQAMESAKNVASKVVERAQTAAKEEGLSVSGVAEAAGLVGDESEREAQKSGARQPVTGTGPQEGAAGSAS